ncbi:MAG TPA: SUMF1/EgtB/PvdO family nonheme iron enzyme [Anaerolineae bacterium]|mgnify:CR=1 FL=1|nr:SUMF1/EgtB/PvdO family nonheme iron enzyme [Anaerolineae bacterium]HQJ11223.1 SUMF1/EgtB/PvdO family nonheme iron enzyme [Anaerolineae bacterium]
MPTPYWTDQPVATIEDDHFGFQEYAEALGRVALTGNTPLTIGIFGPRGAGKTSLMHLIWTYMAEQRAPDLRRPYGIWFDARRDHGEKPPWQRLLLQVLAEIREAALTPTDIHNLAQWEVALDPEGRRASRALMEPTSPRTTWQGIEEFRVGFAQLITDQVLGRDATLAIFIDELDDCAPDHVLQLCDAILRFLAVPGCVIFLGVDHQRLTDILSGRESNPASALDKLVQLPFTLPPLQEAQTERFLARIAPTIPVAARRIFTNGLPQNPRGLKRVLNLFQLLLELAGRRAARGSIETLDPDLLAKTVIIHQRYPTLYHSLLEYPHLLQELEARVRGVQPEPGSVFHPGADALKPLLERYAAERPLTRILRSGATFAALEPPDIGRYLHLTLVAARDQSAQAGPDQQLWEDMLSNDAGRIRAAVETARQRETHPLYINALVQFVQRQRSTPVEQRLSAALALGHFGDPRSFDEVVDIPAGAFPCGEERLPYYLLAYRIRRCLVTNAEYAQFLQAHPDIPVPQTRDDWGRAYNWDPERRTYPAGKGNHPVVLVTWDEAAAYCAWAGGRLPTQEEWERAARGLDGRAYPWGNEFAAGRANTRESGLGAPTPVGVFVDGASPEGLLDMAGNVWEWTASDYNLQTKVIRGGAWNFPADSAKVCAVERSRPDNRSPAIGFRVVFPASPKPA